MFGDFCLVAADAFFNQVAKIRHMFDFVTSIVDNVLANELVWRGDFAIVRPGRPEANVEAAAEARPAQKKAAAIKQPNLYLDLNSYLKSYLENDVPWTPAVTLVRGLFVALNMIQAEGIENVWKRTAELAAFTRKAVTERLGLKLFPQPPASSPSAARLASLATDVRTPSSPRRASRRPGRPQPRR